MLTPKAQDAIVAIARRTGDSTRYLSPATMEMIRKRIPEGLLPALEGEVEEDLAAFRGRVPVELLGRSSFPPIGDLPYMLTLPGHAFYWFELTESAPPPSWHEERLPAEERPWLVLLDGLDEIPSKATRVVVRAAIQAFCDRYDRSRHVVTCRTLSSVVVSCLRS